MPPVLRKRVHSSNDLVAPLKQLGISETAGYVPTQRYEHDITAPSCAFLKLPGELRNLIYEYVATNSTFLQRNHQGKLSSTSSLSRVRRQINNEYTGFLNNTPKDIAVVVIDFDFQHVVRYLKDTSGHKVSAKRRVSHSNVKSLSICMQVTALAPKNQTRLEKWLRFITTRDMADVLQRTSYEIYQSQNDAIWEWPKDLDPIRIWPFVDPDSQYGKIRTTVDILCLRSPTPTERRELRKILEALDEYRQQCPLRDLDTSVVMTTGSAIRIPHPGQWNARGREVSPFEFEYQD